MQIGKTALLGLAGVALIAIGYWIGLASAPPTTVDNRQDRELDDAKGQVQDAIRRWSLKSAMSEEEVRRYWSPRTMFIPTRNQGQGMLCIQLRPEPGSVGGSPVYCYQDDFFKPEEKMKLVAEYSDVE